MIVKIKRLSVQEVIEKYSFHRDEQHYLCGHDIPCAVFKDAKRPCCPPILKKHISDYDYEYLYIFFFKIPRTENCHNDTKWETNSRLFAGWCQRLLAKYNKELLDSLRKIKGVRLKINGCSGCTFKKNGTCNDIRPQPEGIGIDVAKMSKDIFKSPLEWMGNSYQIPYYIGIGGFITSTKLNPAKFEKLIRNMHKDYDRRQKTYEAKK